MSKILNFFEEINNGVVCAGQKGVSTCANNFLLNDEEGI